MQSAEKEKSASKKIESRRRYGNRELDALRRKLFHQLSPTTALQKIAAEGVAVCCWRLEAELSSQVRGKPGGETQGEAAPETTTLPDWYGADRQTIRAAIVFISKIIHNFEQCPVLREEWTEGLRECFGEAFHKDVAEWVPANWDALLLATHLTRHAKTFKRPLPDLQGKDEGVIRDPEQGKQMVLKLLCEKRRHLQDLAQIVHLKVSAGKGLNSSPAGSELDFYKGAMHALQGAVAWFGYLKRRGL
jgi:hypothetical protein